MGERFCMKTGLLYALQDPAKDYAWILKQNIYLKKYFKSTLPLRWPHEMQRMMAMEKELEC